MKQHCCNQGVNTKGSGTVILTVFTHVLLSILSYLETIKCIHQSFDCNSSEITVLPVKFLS